MNDKTKMFLKRTGLILAVFVLYVALFSLIHDWEGSAVPILAVAATTITVFVALRVAKKFNL